MRLRARAAASMVVAVAASVALTAGAPPVVRAPIGAVTAAQERAPTDLVDWRPGPPASWPDPPPATARSFLLLDVATGQPLAIRAGDEPRLIASTVKLLTLITALQRLSLDDEVVVGPEADPGDGGAGASVDPGETWSVRDLVEAVIVRSGNDAARAIAGAVTDGDLDAFTQQMRETAAALGVGDIVLTEPTGLDDGNRLSARALGTIARVALATPGIREAAGQDTVDLPGLDVLPNRNLLIGSYDGATGLKTGYTHAAGWCLVATAKRDGRELLAIVLGARDDADRFDEAAALLDYGFGQLSSTPAPALQAREAGAWEPIAPAGVLAGPPATPPRVQLSGTAASLRLEVRADGVVLGARTVQVVLDAPTTVGQALADTMYGAMRQAHAAHVWPPGVTDTAGAPSG